MTHTQTTTRNTNHYFRMVVMLLAVLAMMASMVATAPKPAHAANGIFVVNSDGNERDNDPFDHICDVSDAPGEQCTLPAAVDAAGFEDGPSLIQFDIPGSGVHTIKPDTRLSIGHTTIDGYSQPGASPNTLENGDNAVLKIEVDGSNVPAFNSSGLSIGNGSVVKGLVINNYRHNGIAIEVGSNNKVEGNFIGTDPTGTKAEPNTDAGVFVGDPLPGGPFDPTNNIIGGGQPAARNVISGNFGSGVVLNEGSNFVVGNYIGTDKNGTGPLGNGFAGVFVNGIASKSAIGLSTAASSNTIAFNTTNGVTVDGDSTGNTVGFNSIFSNGGGMGIDLARDGVTPNDLGDGDSGPNTLQNFPVISAAKASLTKTAIIGTLPSFPNKTYTVRFYSNPEASTNGTGEGKTFLGQTVVTTNKRGNASFSFSPTQYVAPGQAVAATATAEDGSTSEFSVSKTVTSDTVAPKVLSTVPKPKATGVSPTANIQATFSEDMLASSVNGKTFKLFKKGSTTKVAATVSYNVARDKATIDPTKSLQKGATYKAVVTIGAKDLIGNALDQAPKTAGNQPKTWTFTVKN